jgi:hypothetical protein
VVSTTDSYGRILGFVDRMTHIVFRKIPLFIFLITLLLCTLYLLRCPGVTNSVTSSAAKRRIFNIVDPSLSNRGGGGEELGGKNSLPD